MKELWKVTKLWAFLVFACAFCFVALITMPIWCWFKGAHKVADKVADWFGEKGESLGFNIS